jgi:probable rRNA maturation factor
MTRLSKENYRIEIADEQIHRIDSEHLIAAVRLILTEHDFKEAEISIALVDDPTIRKHNQQYLAHDYETDVISFQLEYDQAREFLSGQLIVSTDTAISVSSELGIPMANELLLYVVHGTLHLVGYDDTTPELAAEMRSAEKRYLQHMGVDHHWVDESVNESENAHDAESWLEPNSFDASIREEDAQ